MRTRVTTVIVAAALAVAAIIASILQASASASTSPADIVFLRGVYRIWIMAADGTHQRQLSNDVSNFPQWSPDRQWIAYTAESLAGSTPSQEIWLMRPNGSAKRQLTHLYPAQAVGLSWSPDGTRIAYARDAREPSGLWAVDVNGSGSTAITNDDADSTPSWAPDGKHLLFTKVCCSASGPQRKQQSTIFIINANGNDERRFLKLPSGSCGDQNPSWSPDGKRVVFGRCIDLTPQAPPREGGHPERTDLWVVGANGRALRRLAKNGSQPSWSPDGHWIVFSALASGAKTASLFKIHPNGSGRVRLTRDPRGDQAPDW
jgi:TolB protein